MLRHLSGLEKAVLLLVLSIALATAGTAISLVVRDVFHPCIETRLGTCWSRTCKLLNAEMMCIDWQETPNSCQICTRRKP